MPHFKTVTSNITGENLYGLVLVTDSNENTTILDKKYIYIKFTENYIFAQKTDSLEIYFFTKKPYAPLKKIIHTKRYCSVKILAPNAILLDHHYFYLFNQDEIAVEKIVDKWSSNRRQNEESLEAYLLKSKTEVIYIDNAYYFPIENAQHIERVPNTPLFIVTKNDSKILYQKENNTFQPILSDCEEIFVYWNAQVLIYRKGESLHYRTFVIRENNNLPILLGNSIHFAFTKYMQMDHKYFVLTTENGDYLLHYDQILFPIPFFSMDHIICKTDEKGSYTICRAQNNAIYLVISYQDTILFQDQISDYQITESNNLIFSYQGKMCLYYGSRIFTGYASVIPYQGNGFILTEDMKNGVSKQIIATQHDKEEPVKLVDCNANLILDFTPNTPKYLNIIAKVDNQIQIGKYSFKTEQFIIYYCIDDILAYEVEEQFLSSPITAYRMIYTQNEDSHITRQLFWQEDLFLLLEENEVVTEVVHCLRTSSYYCIIQKDNKYKLLEKGLDNIISYESKYTFDKIEPLKVEYFHKKSYTLFRMFRYDKEAMMVFQDDIFQFLTDYYYHIVPHEKHLSFEIGDNIHLGVLDILNHRVINIKYDKLDLKVYETAQVVFYIATLGNEQQLLTEYGYGFDFKKGDRKDTSKNALHEKYSKISINVKSNYLIIIHYIINNKKGATSFKVCEYKKKIVPSIIEKVQRRGPDYKLQQLSPELLIAEVDVYRDDIYYYFYSTDIHKDYIFMIPRKKVKIREFFNVGSGYIERAILPNCQKVICLYAASIIPIGSVIQFLSINQRNIVPKNIFDKTSFNINGYQVKYNTHNVTITKGGEQQSYHIDELLKVELKYVLKKDCDAS